MNKVKIIAEIGVNHDGKFDKAIKLINSAKKIGVDIIKFQFYRTENISIKNLRLADYQKKNSKFKNQYEMLKRLELSNKEIINLCKYSKKKGIKTCISFFSHQDLNILKICKVDYVKVPSGEINNTLLLKEISKLKKKIIISTGMSNFSEIDNALKIISRGISKKNISILQCTSSYPAPFEDLNLKTINTIKKKYRLKTGFSDHSLGIEASIAAVSIGAEIIEKHLTINKKSRGPDHKASLDVNEFKKMIFAIRNIEKSLGNKKYITPSEKKNFKIVRKKVVANTNIKKGELISIDKIGIKRSNDFNALNADKVDLVLNKYSKKNYKKDEAI